MNACKALAELTQPGCDALTEVSGSLSRQADIDIGGASTLPHNYCLGGEESLRHGQQWSQETLQELLRSSSKGHLDCDVVQCACYAQAKIDGRVDLKHRDRKSVV